MDSVVEVDVDADAAVDVDVDDVAVITAVGLVCTKCSTVDLSATVDVLFVCFTVRK